MAKITNWSDGDVLTASEMNDLARIVYQADSFPAVGSLSVSGLDLETDKRYTVCIKGAGGTQLRFNTSTTTSGGQMIASTAATYTQSPGSMFIQAVTDTYGANFTMGDIMQDTNPCFFSRSVFGRGASNAVQRGESWGFDYGTTANVTTMHFIVGSPPPAGSIWIWKNKAQIS